ncbi:ribonuclease J [Candidatus Saccharibacteria bacterium]|nr:ribonuclease J [Candidatus Saccharibacteria bacterium]
MKQRMQPKNPEERREKQNKYQSGSKQNGQQRQRIINKEMKTNRGEAIRAGRRNFDTADKAVDRWNVFEKHHEKQAGVLPLQHKDRLRVTFLGGLEGIGEKNMMVLEFDNEAIIVDSGFDLSVDLPGVNYAIPATQYVESIKHKVKAYAITHGHMDHIAALPYVFEHYPAPIFCASHFTKGMIEKQFENINQERGTELEPEIIVLNMDDHERHVISPHFTIEFVRITHSIPDCSTLVIETPVGRVINTGDFRLDPEPLDHHPSDITRLKQLGDEGKTLLLMPDSTNARYPGRTPTEHTLQQSFHDIFEQSRGRIFVAIFSTNMNRVQMIINSAVAAGRKVAFDGRGMMQVSEIAVRTGNLKIPKGSVVAMREVANVKDDQVVVVCTGGQGEPNAALQRMSIGEHKHIKLKPEDTVIVSSSPIPGNEVRYQQIGNDLAELGVTLFRQVTRDLDGCGPLHVSGHANQEELTEMVEMTKPKYVLPIHGGMLDRKYNGMAAKNAGLTDDDVILAKNGSMIEFDANGKMYDAGDAPAGAVLVDQTGAVVPGLVAKDRLLMSEEGMVVVMLTVDKKSGRLLTSPDIITRGFIYIRDNTELMDGLRAELKRAAAQRFSRVDLDRFKQELKDHISHYLYEHTRRSPVLIPVVNVIGGNGRGTARPKPEADTGR